MARNNKYVLFGLMIMVFFLSCSSIKSYQEKEKSLLVIRYLDEFLVFDTNNIVQSNNIIKFRKGRRLTSIQKDFYDFFIANYSSVMRVDISKDLNERLKKIEYLYIKSKDFVELKEKNKQIKSQNKGINKELIKLKNGFIKLEYSFLGARFTHWNVNKLQPDISL